MTIPAGPKIDCHIHAIDPVRFPYADDTPYRPSGQEIAPAAHLIRVLDAFDVSHALIVATNTGYGSDSRILLDALRLGDGRFKGVAVVDPAHHFLGVVAAARGDAEISAGRPALPVVDVLEEDMHVRIDEAEPLESLLGSEGLGRLGAMVAVDRDGVLQGVVTLAEVRKALRVAT